MRPRTIQHTLFYNCVYEVETYCIYLFCAVDFSQQKRAKHGQSLLARRATPEHPSFTLINLILLVQWNVETCTFSLYQKGRGTDTVLSRVQSLGLRTKTFNISDLRKTLSIRILKLPLSKQKAYCNVLL